MSNIYQREVGSDTLSFASALRHVLRQDPDVILVGEIRDMETLDTALKAADTGHLVFSTLHTTDATQTINRDPLVLPAAPAPGGPDAAGDGAPGGGLAAAGAPRRRARAACRPPRS